jgi:hypothetical protein
MTELVAVTLGGGGAGSVPVKDTVQESIAGGGVTQTGGREGALLTAKIGGSASKISTTQRALVLPIA